MQALITTTRSLDSFCDENASLRALVVDVVVITSIVTDVVEALVVASVVVVVIVVADVVNISPLGVVASAMVVVLVDDGKTVAGI